MKRCSRARALRLLGVAFFIMGSSVSGHAVAADVSPSAEVWPSADVDVASTAPQAAGASPTQGSFDKGMILLVGLAAAGYSIRRHQRALESLHAIAG